MEVQPGYRVEKYLSEPAVVSPVAMEFDEYGRLYVVEDRGYPLDTEGKVGRIKLLEDRDGDGIPEKVTIFADKLTLPTGVMRWKNGILVTDAPDVWYLEDTNGDGVADVRKKVLTGFAFTNPQHTVNSPYYGLDNWIYLAHENAATAIIFQEKFGDRGSDVRYVDRENGAVITERGRNVRFQPDSGKLEALSGPSQFGQTFDEWGHHFTLNNTYHIRHEVIAARYLTRNPDLPAATATEEISDHGIPAKVFPIAPRQRFEMLTGVGQFTSACGLTLYLGGAFPKEFEGSSLVAEPAHNVVHRDVVTPAGATFSARRTPERTEFIASRDPWFRPVNFSAGPDGAIYMLDYYRLVIEHPEWMAAQESKPKELYAGNDRGRIYRITPSGKPLALARGVRLGDASPEELVRELANPNIWWRRTAQRLLVDRKPAAAVGPLNAMAQSHPSAVARLHAIWALDGLGRLDPALIEKALSDPAPGIRENAIRLAEERLAAEPKLVQRLITLENDPDARVRFQLLATLGGLDSAAVQTTRDRILFRDVEDRWAQIAALSGGSGEARRLFDKAVNGPQNLVSSESKGRTAYFRQVMLVMGARKQPAEIEAAVAAIARPAQPTADWWRVAALEGLATGLRGGNRRGQAMGASREPRISVPRAQQTLLVLFESAGAPVRRAALHVLELAGLPAQAQALLKRAEASAQDRKADPELRADSIGLLALARPEDRRAMLEGLVDSREPEAVQTAAIRALGYIQGPETGKFLIGRWRQMTSAVRVEAADALYRDPGRVPLVVASLKNGDIQAWTLAFRHKIALIMHRDPAIREAARPLLESSGGDRAKIIEQYLPALERKADASNGKKVFENICAKCHKLNGVGADVGPDLATMRHQPKQVLLTDILNPSLAISQGYEAYVVELVAGGSLDGVLGPQTASTLTLRHEQGKEDVIQRKDIKQMYATNLSAMPADVEKQVDIQQMADLLEYLKSSPN
jgi:putative membrane-bound dehydrogenase-like protein